MGRIICYDDPCPGCGEHHHEFPQACLDAAHDQLIEAQLLGNDEPELYKDMRNYAAFWQLSPDNLKNGDLD